MTKKAPKEVKRDLPELLPTPPGDEEKKSDILLRFAEPILFGNEGLDETKETLYMAIIAWNLSFLPPHRCAKAFASMFGTYSLATLINGKRLIAELVERKKKDFAEHEWMINDINLEVAKNGKTLLSVSYVKLGEGDERRAILSTIDGVGIQEGREIVEKMKIERANAANEQQNPI